MTFNADDIFQLTGTIWDAMLKLPIEPAAAEGVSSSTRSTVACIQITGAWSGAIVLDCPAEIARKAASIMFGAEAQNVTVCDLQDAVAELVNMIGGNIKALLPETCFLSLPSVVEGGDYSTRVPGSRLAERVGFSCEGESVTITVLEKVENKALAA